MKKIGVAVAAIVLIVAAAAFAQEQINTYKVTASTSPTKAGSKKHPVAVGLKFNYTVGEQSGTKRPGVVKQYKIKFAGIRVNTKGFKTCNAAAINVAQSDSVCRSAAKIGAGTVENTVGPTSDPSNQDNKCVLGLTIYNARKNHASLYLEGTCVGTPIHNAIDGAWVRSGSSTTLQFTVPNSLLHPVPGLDNAVTRVASSISRKFAGVRKGRHGYLSSIGGCSKKKKRAVTVTFVQEDGLSRTAQGFAKCRK